MGVKRVDDIWIRCERSDSTEVGEESGGLTTMFKRHKYLSYEGYSFPWYMALLWIGFFVLGLGYLVRYILLQE